jgi:hypothetical protein
VAGPRRAHGSHQNIELLLLLFKLSFQYAYASAKFGNLFDLNLLDIG